jgi:hypothetical protein
VEQAVKCYFSPDRHGTICNSSNKVPSLYLHWPGYIPADLPCSFDQQVPANPVHKSVPIKIGLLLSKS